MKSLKEKIKEDLKDALIGKRESEVSTLRMILASILNKEKEKRYKIAKEKPDLTEKELVEKSQLTNEELTEVIFSEIKKRKEAVLEFEKGKRWDLVEKEKLEIEILKKYLPEQLTEEEIKKLAKEIIKKVGATEPKDIGKVMAELMSKVKGRAEGNLVSSIVKKLLVEKEDT